MVLKNPGTAHVTGGSANEATATSTSTTETLGDITTRKSAPEVLYNFKGEPAYAIKDFLPEYHTRASSSRRV